MAGQKLWVLREGKIFYNRIGDSYTRRYVVEPGYKLKVRISDEDIGSHRRTKVVIEPEPDLQKRAHVWHMGKGNIPYPRYPEIPQYLYVTRDQLSPFHDTAEGLIQEKLF